MPTKQEKLQEVREVTNEIVEIAREYLESLDDSDPLPAAIDLIKNAIEAHESHGEKGET